jgi:chromosome segregation ATPase
MPKTRITLATIHKQMKQLATKDQLANLATKQELRNTREELSNLAAKVDGLAVLFQSEFQRVNQKLDEHTQELKDLRGRVDTLHGLMENLLVRTERLEQEYTMITAGLKRLETRFDDLEAARLRQRIDALEKRVTALESVQN